jgi:hypothetical protein
VLSLSNTLSLTVDPRYAADECSIASSAVSMMIRLRENLR